MKDKNINKEKELFNIWQKAGNSIHHQQQLNKEKMETLLNKTSSDLLFSIQKLIKADALFKTLLLIGFLVLATLNLTNIFVLTTTIISLAIIAWSITNERKLIDTIDDLKQTDDDIQKSLKDQLNFYKTNIYRYSFLLSISIALFYILGSLAYHQIKYGTINPVRDMTDGLVLLGFLFIAMSFSFIVNFPVLKARMNTLQRLLNDFEEPELIALHIEKDKKEKQRLLLISAILIIIGIVVLVTLVILFMGTPSL